MPCGSSGPTSTPAGFTRSRTCARSARSNCQLRLKTNNLSTAEPDEDGTGQPTREDPEELRAVITTKKHVQQLCHRCWLLRHRSLARNDPRGIRNFDRAHLP